MSIDPPTLARLAATTPARDWVRLRLTGRLDWRATIAESELPEALAALVTRVVARSRLWRIEKADVARELCTHFTDGLGAGRSPEALIADFGDPRRASRLVRRAKRRNRHWIYRSCIRAAQVAGVLLAFLLLIYAALAMRFFLSEPNIARNYAAEYNATIARIPERDRAWELYVETYVLTERPPKGLERIWPDIAPAHPRYREALAYLEREGPVLGILHDAAARPRLGAPLSDAIDPRMIAADERRSGETGAAWPEPSENPLLITILLPELGHFRQMARLLTFDAHVAARGGDAERAARDLATMLRLAGHAAEHPTLIAQLVGLAIHGLAVQTTAQIVHDSPSLFSDAQLRDLAHLHAAFMGGSPRIDTTGERWYFEDMVQRVYSDDGNGNGHITADGVRALMSLQAIGTPPTISDLPLAFGPVTSAVLADRASMTAMYDRLMTRLERNAQRPLWDQSVPDSAHDEIERLDEDAVARIRYAPVFLFLPAIEVAARAAEYTTQRRDALLTGLALERYRRERGGYPDALDRLVPAYLPAVPPDRFTGQPLRYALADGEPRIWSVGADRNDDGGRAPAVDSSKVWTWVTPEEARRAEEADPAQFDGDWVLWPVVYKPIAAEESDDADAAHEVGAMGG